MNKPTDPSGPQEAIPSSPRCEPANLIDTVALKAVRPPISAAATRARALLRKNSDFRLGGLHGCDGKVVEHSYDPTTKALSVSN